MEGRFRAFKTRRGIKRVDCESWAGFIEYIYHHHVTSHGIMFRGQSNANWQIESSLLRATRKELKHKYPAWPADQIEALLQSKSRSFGGNLMQSFHKHYSQREGNGHEMKLWMRGRHQHLLTPFIEWTESPFVAAFFAAVEVVTARPKPKHKSYCIHGVSSWLFPQALMKHTADQRPLARWALQVPAAFHSNQRAVAQRAVATYLFPETSVEQFVRETATLEDDEDTLLHQINLPCDSADKAITNLNQMNVNYLSLFPDVAGIALQANLNLYVPNLEGAGNWRIPPGFELLTPPEGDLTPAERKAL